jgi:dipeptidyl aminopeptidase/acylaminoacyl peptidase
MLRQLTIGLLITLSLASCSAKSIGSTTQPQRELIANSLTPNERAEFFWSKPAGDGPFPMIIFLHGHQETGANRIGGRAFVDWGVLDGYAKAGLIAVSVSQPGYGSSEGKPDFCGPKTQAAVRAVIDHFRATKFVDPRKIAIEGISRGAVVAAMVAAHDANVRTAILIGGVYDLKGYYNDHCAPARKTSMPDSICQSISEEMPINDEEFANRSALDYAANIKAQILILHGAEDQNAPAGQAQTFADALRKAGANIELHIFPGVNHQIPLRARQPIVNAFLKRTLGLAQELPGQ